MTKDLIQVVVSAIRAKLASYDAIQEFTAFVLESQPRMWSAVRRPTMHTTIALLCVFRCFNQADWDNFTYYLFEPS